MRVIGFLPCNVLGLSLGVLPIVGGMLRSVIRRGDPYTPQKLGSRSYNRRYVTLVRSFDGEKDART